ncbi:hypothetical protein D3C80_848930 [compost metagenome]
MTAADFAFDTVDGQAVGQRLLDLVDDFLAVTASALDRLVDARGAHRVHGLETEVFEFHAHAVHPQAIGDGGVDFQGFFGDAPALFA